MKKVTAAIFTLCLLLSFAMPCFAAQIGGDQPTGDVEITVQVPDTHTLTVSMKNGSVSYDGNEGSTLEVPRLAEFALDVRLDNDYTIKRIALDGTDVTGSYKDGKLTLSGIYAPAALEVVTEKIGGTFEVDDPDPKPGDKVTIRPIPDEGYEVDEVIVTDEDGENIEVTDNGDGSYSFIQPEGEVEITVTFKKIEGSGGDTPETADAGDLLLLTTVMLLAGTALIGTALYGKRRRSNG